MTSVLTWLGMFMSYKNTWLTDEFFVDNKDNEANRFLLLICGVGPFDGAQIMLRCVFNLVANSIAMALITFYHFVESADSV